MCRFLKSANIRYLDPLGNPLKGNDKRIELCFVESFHVSSLLSASKVMQRLLLVIFLPLHHHLGALSQYFPGGFVSLPELRNSDRCHFLGLDNFSGTKKVGVLFWAHPLRK